MSQFNGTQPNNSVRGPAGDHSVIDANDPRIETYIYAGKPAVVGGTQQKSPAYTVTPPDVPNYDDGGSGSTVVNTDALKTFRDNIQKLTPFVTQASKALATQPYIAAGGYPGGFALDTTYKTSLFVPYTTVLDDLGQGLGDLGVAIDNIIGKYTSVDELNGMTATEFDTDIDTPDHDFTLMMKANGGNGNS